MKFCRNPSKQCQNSAKTLSCGSLEKHQPKTASLLRITQLKRRNPNFSHAGRGSTFPMPRPVFSKQPNLGFLTCHAAACMPRPAMLTGQFLACFLSAQFSSMRAMALISHARRSSLQHFNPLSIKLSLDLLLLFFKNLDSTTLVPPFCTQSSFY